MQTNIYIYPAKETDAADISAVEALCFSDAWSEASVRSALSSPLTAALVAYVGGVCVGYLLSSLLSPEGELLRIGVHPSYRRRGIGAMLMEGFLKEAKTRECTRLFLEVRADNEGAIALYRRFGFLDNGIRRGYYKNPTADALLMHRNGDLG